MFTFTKTAASDLRQADIDPLAIVWK